MAPAAVQQKPVLGSLGIPNGTGKSVEEMAADSSKLASPTDSENAEKNMAALETAMNGSLHIPSDPVVSHPSMPTAADYNADPLSATALTSPLHTINWDSLRPGSLDAIAASSAPPTSSAGLPPTFQSTGPALWESFKRTGPRYPPSLEKLLMDYHHKHSKSWQLAHDMGAGSGVYSPVLARYFRHVHVSDPSKSGLATSRQALSAWSADNKKSRGRFTFSHTKAELANESVADRTLDMAILMEGAHFTAPDVLVRNAAQTLSSNGTLAIVSYSPICRVTGNPGANDAVQRLFAAWGTPPWDVVAGTEAQSKKNFSLGLDFIPLPEDIFDATKTRRITINTHSRGSGAFSSLVPGTTADASESRVRVNVEKRQEFSSENGDEQAKGWRQEVGPEFFRGLTAAIVGSANMAPFEKHFTEITKIIHETSPNGIMITVEWTVAVVLATRR